VARSQVTDRSSDTHQTAKIIMTNSSPLAVSKPSDSHWRVTFDNPPLNLIDPEMIVALRDLVDKLEADPAVKVVIDSADEE
jgi:enoyl-CoA hydratase/carnithine racemase